MGQRTRIDRRLEPRIVDPVQLQREEQQVGGGIGDLFLRVAIKFCPHRIGGVAGIDEPGIGHDAAQQIFEVLIGAHRLAELCAGLRTACDLVELAAPPG